MVAYKYVLKLFNYPKRSRARQDTILHLNILLNNCFRDYHEEPMPFDSHENGFPKLSQLSQSLRNVDVLDRRLINTNDHTVLTDDRVTKDMLSFKSLARYFIGSPKMQQALANNSKGRFPFFCKPSERVPVTITSLTEVCNFLNISAQHKKLVRLAICPQVTQYQIWTGALEELLTELKTELDVRIHQSPSNEIKMAQQIVSTCLEFLNVATSYDLETASWMRLSPKRIGSSPETHSWGEVGEMFGDLISCLKFESELVSHLTRLEAMKEGLFQIKDLLIDKSIGYRESQFQESLLQKKLTKSLGHSSRCLFILLLYYLYGSISAVDLDLCGGFCEAERKNNFYLYMGKILTSNDEKMVMNGLRQLNKALGLFEFVWKTTGVKGAMELQGHLWSVGAEERFLSYRGHKFFVHGIIP
ncbi:uncharacterized protein LOC124919274 [Impatiens glandulifera]|uniref:uncharacterized protein LOC124919274 n=1 Tax=Impatiens glandulifera TaxID=253017 RepID=UPI001FB19E1A|nr:uncharacterized protein LOC124919274 [Impatiens glandulifera]